METEEVANKLSSAQSRAKVNFLSPEPSNIKPKPLKRQDRSPKTSTTSNPGPSLEVKLDDRAEEDSPGEEEVSVSTDEIDEFGYVGGDEEEEDPLVLVEEVVLNGLEGG